MQSYVCNGKEYFFSKFTINNYQCFYEYYLENGQYYVYLSNYDEDLERDYMIIGPNLNKAKKQLRKRIENDLLNKKNNLLLFLGYKIFLVLPNLLMDCFSGIAYHISPINNTKSILQKGLIPSLDIDPMVKNANVYINKNKPKSIDFNREDCVYFHPEIENDLFSMHEKYYTNSALFAVNISPYMEKAIITSEGISGFCMWDEEYSVDFKDIEKWSKKYWQISRKLNDYLNHPPKYPTYDLSEIIIPSKISPNDISYIGFWDAQSQFQITDSFKNFVKNEYKNNYLEIIKKYS